MNLPIRIHCQRTGPTSIKFPLCIPQVRINSCANCICSIKIGVGCCVVKCGRICYSALCSADKCDRKLQICSVCCTSGFPTVIENVCISKERTVWIPISQTSLTCIDIWRWKCKISGPISQSGPIDWSGVTHILQKILSAEIVHDIIKVLGCKPTICGLICGRESPCYLYRLADDSSRL